MSSSGFVAIFVCEREHTAKGLKGKLATKPLRLPSTMLSSILPLDMNRHGKVERTMSWTKLLTPITGSVDQELLLRNAYLVTENRLLRKQLPGRVRLSYGERKTLAAIGKKLGKQV